MKLALLRKDLRLLRLPLVGGLLLAVLPYLVYAAPRVGQWWQDRHDTVDRSIRTDNGSTIVIRPPSDWADISFFNNGLFPAALAGLGLVALTAAACGGIAFATERRDGSADFLALLPVSRRRAVTSKLLAAAACLVLPAAVHLVVFALGWRELSQLTEQSAGYSDRFFIGAANCAALAVMMFGVAWLLSSVLDSPAVAATVAVGVAAVTVYLIANVAWQMEMADDVKPVMWTPAEYVIGPFWRPGPGVYYLAPPSVHVAVQLVAALAGALAMVLGGLMYARRARP